ncbi:MAG: VCBS domain-containing protein, partial [Gammaproteobacteria bacterium]|nr:VCBS domain-containing protein [Gammaproteobacteria bacterium]
PAKIIVTYTDPATLEDDKDLDNPYGSTVTVDLLTNDEKDGDKINPKSIKLIDKDGNEVVGNTLKVDGEGTWTVNDNGTVTFKPETGFEGNPAPIEYTAKTVDGGLAKAPAKITVTYLPKPEEQKPLPTLPSEAETVVEGSREKETNEPTFKVTNPENVGTLLVNGQDITGATENAPVTIKGAEGTLKVTGFDKATGEIKYTYTENGKGADHTVTAGDATETPQVGTSADKEVKDEFILSGTAKDGRPLVPGKVTVTVTDTEPTAKDDTETVGEDDAKATGNVLTGEDTTNTANGKDTINADKEVTVTGVAKGDDTSNPVTGKVSTDIEGEFGTLTLNSDGTYTYIPDQAKLENVNAGTSVEDKFVYTITDADGDKSTAKLTIMVNGADEEKPVLPSDEQTLVEATGDEVTDSVIIKNPEKVQDLMVGGKAIPADVSETNPVEIVGAQGTLKVTGYDKATGELTYTYKEDGDAEKHNATKDNIVDDFAITANDSQGNPVTAGNLHFLITDTQPTAKDDTATVGEDSTTPATGNVVTTGEGKDTVIDPVKVTAIKPNSVTGATEEPVAEGTPKVIEGKYGTLTLKDDGTYSYTPDQAKLDKVGDGVDVVDSFTYTITDNNGDKSTAKLDITVNGADEPAKATLADDEDLNNPYGTPVTVELLADDEADGDKIDPSTIKLIVPEGLQGTTLSADGKTMTVENQGTWTVNDGTEEDKPAGTVTFIPKEGVKIDPTPIEYTAKTTDGGAVEAPATITVTYKDSSTLKDDYDLNNVIGEDVTVKILENDPDGKIIDKSTIKLLDPITEKPVEGPLETNEGTWTVNADGTVTFSPKEGFEGDPKPVKYTAKTTEGGLVEEPAEITITYKDAVIPPKPDLADDVKLNNPAGTAVTINVVENDGDDNIDPATVKLVGGTKGGKELVVAGEGTWTVADNGEVTFTPEPTFKGDPKPVEYTAQNTAGVDVKAPATITIDYKEPADLADDKDLDNEFGSTVTVNLLENDEKDGDDIDPASIKLIAKDGSEVTTLEVEDQGTWTVQADGTVKFEPKDGFKGNPDPIQYIAKDTDGGVVKAPAEITVTYLPEPDPKLEILKTSVMPSDAKVGSEVTYIFEVKNTGNVDVNEVKITDKKLGLTDESITSDKFTLVDGNKDDAVLSTKETIKLSVKYTLTQEDFDAGKVENTATAKGTDPQGTEVTDKSDDPNDTTNVQDNGNPADPTVDPLAQDPKLDLIKEVTVPADAEVGTELTYTFTVTNKGNVSVDNVTISDNKLENFTDVVPTKIIKADGREVVVNPGETVKLAPNDKAVVEGTYTLQQSDFDAGKVENSATVKGTDPKGTEVTDTSDDPTDATNSDPNGDGNPDDPTVRPLTQDPELKLLKVGVVADTSGDGVVGNEGDTITYTFTVQNIGNVTVSDIKVSDERIGVKNLVVTPSELAPSTEENPVVATATADYVITFDDVLEGKIENQATATGQDPKGNPVSDLSDDPNDTTTTDSEGNPAQDPTVTPLKQPLPVITGGAETLVEKTGDDVANTLPVSNPKFVKTLILTDEKGTEYNVLDATAANPIVITTDKGELKVLGFDKETGKIAYQYEELDKAQDHTNNAEVKDVFTLSGTSLDGSDIAAKTLTVNITDTAPVAEPDTNTVKEDANKEATGNVIKENDTVNADEDVTVIGVAKGDVSDTDQTENAGTEVEGEYGKITINADGSYTYVLNNDDPKVQALNDGEVKKDTFTYTITDKDGNTSTTTIVIDVQGNTGLPPKAINDEDEGKRDPQTGKLVAKTQPIVEDDYDKDGTIDPTTVEIKDADEGSNGKTKTVQGEGVWTVDKETGEITFTPEENFNSNPTEIKYTVKDNDGNPSNEATVNVTYPPSEPKIEIIKTTGDIPTTAKAGDEIEYTFTVTNKGNVELKGITITDDKVSDVTLDPASANGVTSLADVVLKVGQSITLTGKRVLEQKDFDAGEVINSATVDAKAFDETPVTDVSDDPKDTTNSDPNGDGNPDDPTVRPLTQDPELKLLKVAVSNGDTNGDGIEGGVGDTITYTFTVENIGNVTVSDIKIDDPRIKVADLPVEPANLAPNETATATFDYTITFDDVLEGKIENQATATGQDPNGKPVSDLSDDPNDTTNTDSEGNPAQDPTVTPLVQPLPVITGDEEEVVEATSGVVADNMPVSNPKFVETLTIAGADGEKHDITKATADNPVKITTDEGKLEILGFNKETGEISYKYTEDGKAETHTKPDNNDFIKDIFTLEGFSKDGSTIAPKQLVIKITDTQPVAKDDKNTITEDDEQPVTGNVVEENDIKNADKEVTVTAVKSNEGADTAEQPVADQPAVIKGKYGTLTLNKDGSYSYQLDGLENQELQDLNDEDTVQDTFTYTITDSDGDTSPATLTIDVKGNTDYPPVANNDAKDGLRDPNTGALLPVENIDTITNDKDVDGKKDPTTVQITAVDDKDKTITITEGGKKAVVNGEGTWTVDPTTGAMTFTPQEGFDKDPTPIKYTMKDDDGLLSNEATVTVTYPKSEVDVELIKGTTNTPLPDNATVGTEIEYTFTIKNTGNLELHGITLEDSKVDLTKMKLVPNAELGITADTALADVKLPKGKSIQVTAKHALTQEDFEAGKVENTAKVKAIGLNGEKTEDTSDSTNPDDNDNPLNNTTDALGHNGDSTDDPTVTPIKQHPKLELTKADTVPALDTIEVGKSEITYTFTIKNIGDVSVKEVTITDETLGLDNVSIKDAKFTFVSTTGTDDTTLEVGETMVVSINKVITQEDIDAGKVVNTATVDGKGPLGQDVTDVSDSMHDSTDDGVDNPTADDNFDPADPNNPPSDNPLSQDTDDTNDPTVSPLQIKPVLELTKGSSVTQPATVGSKVTYTFTVTNTGKVTVKDMTITDEVLGLKDATALKVEGELAPGESKEVTYVYELTQTDFNNGKIVNTATVNGMGSNGVAVEDVSDDPNDNTNVDPNNDGNPDDPTVLKLYDLVDDEQLDNPYGSTVTVDVLTNDKEDQDPVDPTTVKIIDPATGEPVTTDDGSLTVAGQGKWTVDKTTGEVTFTPEKGFDGNPTPIQYEAQATDGTPIAPATVTITYLPNPQIEILKTSSMPADAKVGSEVTYTFEVKNTGNIDLNDVKITDAKLNLTDESITSDKFTLISDSATHDTTLEVGETIKLSIKYELTQDDFDSGKVENTATAKGTDPKGTEVTDKSDDPTDTTDVQDNGNPADPTVDPLAQEPKLDLIKEVTVPTDAKVGTELTYTFTVTNTGNVSVDNVTISDNKLENFTDVVPTKIIKADGSEVVVNQGETVKLAPNDKAVVEGKYTLQQSDFDAGKVENSATVKGTDPKGTEVTDTSDDPTDATNSDPNGDGNPDDPTVRPLDQTPVVELVKADTLPATVAVGEKINYTFTITNKGNVTVNDLTISDTKLELDKVSVKDAAKFTISAEDTQKLADGLQPNESIVVTLKEGYAITQEDLNAGKVVNTATVIGKDPKGQDVTDISDSASANGTPEDNDSTTAPASDNPLSKDGDETNDPTVTPVQLEPVLELTKGSSVVQPATAGSKVTYTFTVTNTGKVSVTDMVITDAKLGLTGDKALKVGGTLAPNESATVTATNILTAQDFIDGEVVNTATVNGTGTNGVAVEDVSDSKNPADQEGQPNNADADQDDTNDPNVLKLYDLKDDEDLDNDWGTPVTVDVVTNDKEDQDPIDPTTVKIIDPATGEPVTTDDGSFTVPGQGKWTVDPTTGAITFTPEEGFDGDPTPIDYMAKTVASDGNPSVPVAPATVTITYQKAPKPVLPSQDKELVEGEKGTVDQEPAKEGDPEFKVTNPENVKTVAVNGQDVTNATAEAPVIIEGENGTLKVTGYDPASGKISYTYTENGKAADHTTAEGDATEDPQVGTSADKEIKDEFTLSAVSKTGVAIEPGKVSVEITDTQPVAKDDTDSVGEDDTTPATGNVITGEDTTNTADGKDVVKDAVKVTAIKSDDGADTTEQAVEDGKPKEIIGKYGKLVLNDDGSYTYTPDQDKLKTVDAGTDVVDNFTYTITDADGDTSQAQLAITVNGADEITPTIAGDNKELVEKTGDDVTDNLKVTNPEYVKTLTIAGADGVAKDITNASVDNPVSITTDKGTVEILGFNKETGDIIYKYTENGERKDHLPAEGKQNVPEDDKVGTENDVDVKDTFTIAGMSKADKPIAPAELTVKITDTEPAAKPDTNSVKEDDKKEATGNVITDKGTGEDSVNADTDVTVIGVAKGDVKDTAQTTGAGTEVQGEYGKITINPDGT